MSRRAATANRVGFQNAVAAVESRPELKRYAQDVAKFHCEVSAEGIAGPISTLCGKGQAVESSARLLRPPVDDQTEQDEKEGSANQSGFVQPDPDCARRRDNSALGRGRDPRDTDDRNQVEENEIAQVEGASSRGFASALILLPASVGKNFPADARRPASILGRFERPSPSISAKSALRPRLTTTRPPRPKDQSQRKCRKSARRHPSDPVGEDDITLVLDGPRRGQDAQMFYPRKWPGRRTDENIRALHRWRATR